MDKLITQSLVPGAEVTSSSRLPVTGAITPIDNAQIMKGTKGKTRPLECLASPHPFRHSPPPPCCGGAVSPRLKTPGSAGSASVVETRPLPPESPCPREYVSPSLVSASLSLPADRSPWSAAVSATITGLWPSRATWSTQPAVSTGRYTTAPAWCRPWPSRYYSSPYSAPGSGAAACSGRPKPSERD